MLAEAGEREFFGWIAPGSDKFSVWPVVLGALRRAPGLALTTTPNGGARAMVPIGSFERVMPPDLMATLLLRGKANVKATTRIGAYTPLHVASQGGSAPIVKALLASGADARAVTTDGVSALHLAAMGGDAAVVHALVAADAAVNASEPLWGQTPPMLANARGRPPARGRSPVGGRSPLTNPPCRTTVYGHAPG